jgi:hypothetical protein
MSTGVVLVKDGVSFNKIAPGGFRILSAIDNAAYALGLDLVITSACDGEHSGPNDPHHRGEAYDVRSHDFDEFTKQKVLDSVMNYLEINQFYGFLESPGTENEHFHFQVKKGITFPENNILRT